MFEPKIKIPKELHERLKERAEAEGYSSVDEFILHVLEKAAGSGDSKADDEMIAKQLQGLGYID